MSRADLPQRGVIGRQIVLPWRKAFEIALKSIKVRFWRSMITMSSIILAIAFLMFIWAASAITAALAVGPQRELDEVKAKLTEVRQALAEAPKGPTSAGILERYQEDLEDAIEDAQAQLDEAREQLEDASAEEQKKLQAQIEELEALLRPKQRLKLLETYLAERRRQIELTKGEIDAVLQQERATGQAEAEGPAPREAQAGVGGLATDFLRQMSPTDKWLAALALLVCFVGIVNAMFMTVQERFREIGTMKCLGALDSFIVKIFLAESAMLGFIGTLMGMVVGLVLSVLRQWAVYGGAVWRYLSVGSLLLAAVMAAAVGLVLSTLAAIFPARKAARMEPVEAMRIEE